MKRNDLKMILTHLLLTLQVTCSMGSVEADNFFLQGIPSSENWRERNFAQTKYDSFKSLGVHILPRGVGPLLKKEACVIKTNCGNRARGFPSTTHSNYGKSSDGRNTTNNINKKKREEERPCELDHKR